MALTACPNQLPAGIGFQPRLIADRLWDPTRFADRAGFTSVLWDSSAARAAAETTAVRALSPDTTAAETTRTSTSAPTSAPAAGGTAPTEAHPSPSGTATAPPFQPSAPGQPPSGQLFGHGGKEPGAPKAEKTPQDTTITQAPPAYHATLIQPVDIPVDYKTEMDTATNFVVISGQLGGVGLPLSGAMNRELFLSRTTENSDRSAWRASVIKKMPVKSDIIGEGISISIPVFKSKSARRIFGGSNIGLTVSGNIRVNGSLRLEKREEVQAGNLNPTNYQFKVDQTQQFVIKGKVGEKVAVEIDQDSERLFEFENNLKIRYQGEEDEILQTVEAGNVSLSLGGASLVSLSPKHQGLFGFKTESRIGALQLTTIASLKKGETQQISISGGAKTGLPLTVAPYDYIQRRYFFLDSLYRENYRYRSIDLLSISVPSEFRITDIDVYRSVRAGSDESFNAVDGWALSDPTDTTNLSNRNDQEHQNGLFLPLVRDTDYELQTDLGYIRFTANIPEGSIIAVAYQTQLATYGDLDPSDNRDPGSPLFILKLIQPERPMPGDRTWKLMWRNVYSLEALNIQKEGFTGKIVESTGERRDTDNDNKPYIELFGLDQTGFGASEPDGVIDEVFLDFTRGELFFPDLQPFEPEGWFREGALQKANVTSDLMNPDLYTTYGSELRRLTTGLELQFQYSSVSATYDLGYNVLEGSVEVLMNGQKLSPGVDYTVDYLAGELTILRTEALNTTANIEIKYETGELFATDTKTWLGLRAEYELWENSSLGATMAYYSERKLDRRVRVGGEPTRNNIWDMNAHLQFKPQFLTNAVDWLPLIETDKLSTLTLDAEVAQVLPNPNSLNSPSTGDNNGVAYIDDFESITRTTPLGITMMLWHHSGFPEYDNRGVGSWRHQRGRLIWFNPLDQIKVTDIWPDREVQAQASTMPVLRIEFQPWWGQWKTPMTQDIDPTESWAGITRYLGTGYADQTQSKYLEIWLNHKDANSGIMYIDLGRISEDVIPDDKLNTEDRPSENFRFGDGILEPSEDTGLDLIAAPDPADSMFVDDADHKLPSYDDYHTYSRSDYTFINGTEGNKNFEAGRYPDTEDLDNDGGLDRVNDFYRYRIDLSEGDANRYIVGGIGNGKGWRLYRIPLADTLTVGDPSLSSIEYARIWFTGLTSTDYSRPPSVMIAQMDIVGNEWREETASDQQNRTYEPVSVAVINSYDNPGEYEPPPGVSGERDPVTNLATREQSLVMRINRLSTGETGAIVKKLPQRQDMDLLEYRTMKMFVHGGGPGGQLTDRFGRQLDLEFFFRFGTDLSAGNPKYYEYSQRLRPSWLGNEIQIDFDRLAQLKFQRLQDSTRNYDILPNGAVIRVVGEPSLNQVTFFTLGVKNHGTNITSADRVEVWCDELRLSDIYRDPGWAAKGAVSLNVAGDFLNLGADVRQNNADFHSAEQRTGTRKDNLSGRFNATMQLGEFFSPTLGLRMPVAFTYTQGMDVPRFVEGSDIRLSALSGERIDIWNKFLTDLQRNDRFRGAVDYQGEVEKQIKSSKSSAYSVSLDKGKRSDNWLLRYSVDGINLRGGYREDFSAGPTKLYSNSRSTNGDATYSLNIEKPWEISWLFWGAGLPLLNKISESKLRPLPNSFSVNATGAETIRLDASRPQGNRPTRVTETYQFNIGRNYRVGWRPLDILNFDLSQGKTGSRIRDDTTRTAIAEILSELDSLNYYDTTGSFDTARWRVDYRKDIERVRRDIFWKAFGGYFLDNEFTQSFSVGFTPVFVSWLSTETNYNARYRWNWRLESFNPGSRSVGVGTSLSSSVTLRLQQVLQGLGITGNAPRPPGATGEEEQPPPGMEGPPGEELPPPWMEPGGQPPPPEEMPPEEAPPGVPPPQGEQPQPAAPTDTTAAKPKRLPKPTDLLIPLRVVATRLTDVRWDFSRSADFKNSAVGAGQADWNYRLGFSQEPGLPKIPGYSYTDNFRYRWEHKISTGLDITPTIQVSSIEYEFSWSRNLAQKEADSDESGSTSRTVFQMFAKDKVSIRAIPAVNWSVRWSGWEQLPLFAQLAQTVSLDHSFRGTSTETWRKTGSPAERNVERVEYEKAFSPVAGISFAWKGGVGTNFRYNYTQKISDERAGNGTKELDQTYNINLTASYASRKGFKIPIPIWPFNNRRFKNNTTFNLTYDNSMTVQKNSSQGNPFAESNRTSSWSLRPSIDYSFSNSVQGGFHYEYAVQKSLRSGKTRSQEFGFSVNISIKG
jgi:hypothetical protein